MRVQLHLGASVVDHVGIDIGGRETQVCVRSAAGEVLEEVRCRTSDLDKVLSGRSRSCVVVETCTEAFRIANMAFGQPGLTGGTVTPQVRAPGFRSPFTVRMPGANPGDSVSCHGTFSGPTYLAYVQRVPCILPYGWLTARPGR